MTWLHQVAVPLNQEAVPLFELYQRQSNRCATKLSFTRNSQRIHVHNIRDRNPRDLWFTQMSSQREIGARKFLLVSAHMGFLWSNLWSVSRYIMGPFSGWWVQGGNDQQYLAAPIWKCRSWIGDHRSKFFMDLLPNYTFYTSLTKPSIG